MSSSAGPPFSFSPPPGPSQRRESYARIAAGATRRRSGQFGSIAQQLHGEQQPQAGVAHSRQASRNMDMDAQGGYDGAGRATPWAGERQACPQHDDHPPFFTPEYLRRSRHVRRLEQSWNEHLAELEEQARMNTAEAPVLATKSSNGKMHASHLHHRPAVQDVIERTALPTDEDRSHPLPSRWNEDDKMSGLEILADGTEVRFGGVTKTSDEAASIRSDHPMPRECGMYYFEVTILSRGKDGMIGIGVSGKRANLNRLPGWEGDSWAYHGDDGFSFACTASGKAYGPRYSSQDTIGCGVNFRTGNAFFTKNGVYLGVAFTGMRNHGLYPSIGIKKPGEHLRVNFGRTPFVFDITRMMEQERQHVLRDIATKSNVGILHPPDDENALIHKLVGQYLAHEGYVETAKAFARDVHEQQQSLRSEPEQRGFEPRDAGEDVHAVNRQRIRKAILDGEVDRALKFTGSCYPHVLEEERNREVWFRLRCRKFIEMMRRCAELAASSSSAGVAKSVDSLGGDGRGDETSRVEHDGEEDEDEEDEEEAAEDTQMDLEAPPPLPPTDDIDMDASGELPPPVHKAPPSSSRHAGEMLAATLRYGQELQQEFGSDPRPQVKKQLQDLFAIIAYADPRESPMGAVMDVGGRAAVAEGVNGAILVSLGKPSSAALEKLCAQTEALLDETAAKVGGDAAFVDIGADFLQA
ncbi:hypothetical protein LTR08_006186 [Meristemomyces frigidus]|nr:hypothetical protein LTR08_006186 [Meristemomyces frigidus]